MVAADMAQTDGTGVQCVYPKVALEQLIRKNIFEKVYKSNKWPFHDLLENICSAAVGMEVVTRVLRS